MYWRNSTKICTKAKKKSTEKGTNSSIEDDDEDHVQDNFIKEFTKSEIQDAIDRLKREKRRTAMEYELNSSKTAVTTRKKKSGQFQRNCAAGKLYTKELAKDSNPSNLQKM